jgi:hypothetical protein
VSISVAVGIGIGIGVCLGRDGRCRPAGGYELFASRRGERIGNNGEFAVDLAAAEDFHHIDVLVDQIPGVDPVAVVGLFGDPLDRKQRRVLVELAQVDGRDVVSDRLGASKPVLAERRVVVVFVLVPAGRSTAAAVAGPTAVFLGPAAVCPGAALSVGFVCPYRIASRRSSIASGSWTPS